MQGPEGAQAGAGSQAGRAPRARMDAQAAEQQAAAEYRRGRAYPIALRRDGSGAAVVLPDDVRSIDDAGRYELLYRTRVDAIVYLLRGPEGRRDVEVHCLSGDHCFCAAAESCALRLWVSEERSLYGVLSKLHACIKRWTSRGA